MIEQEALDAVMNQLTGRIYNVPPEISAVRVQVRTRKIHDFHFSINPQNTSLLVFAVKQEYIRTMARDMGFCLTNLLN